jgi:hypothetical protein
MATLLVSCGVIIKSVIINFVFKEQSHDVAYKIRDACKHIKLPNFQISIDAGKKQVNVYSPFTAIPHPSWKQRQASQHFIYTSIILLLLPILTIYRYLWFQLMSKKSIIVRHWVPSAFKFLYWLDGQKQSSKVDLK